MISTLPFKHPATAQRLPLRLQRPASPRLSDFPALATAASATTAGLDTDCDTFAAVSACLETLARLNLGVTSARLLLILAKNGPERCKALALDLKTTAANFSGIMTRLLFLGLIDATQGQDRREITLSLTDAGRKVLASLVALTALGQAANVLGKSPARIATRSVAGR